MGSSNHESGLVGLVLIPLVEKVHEGVILHHQADQLLVKKRKIEFFYHVAEWKLCLPFLVILAENVCDGDKGPGGELGAAGVIQ